MPVGAEGITRRTLTLFFLVDTSGSMYGPKIQAVNDAIENVLPIVHDISFSNGDAEIKVACMQFSYGASWMTEEPREANEFEYVEMDAEGLTSMGEAFRELEKKLHQSSGGWMKNAGGSYAPGYILLSDGEPTDDYLSGLKILKANNWFKVGTKVAIAIGNDANTEILKDFTGTSETVLTVHDTETLKKVIRFVAVTSSTIASKSKGVNDSNTQTEVENAIKNEYNTTESRVDVGVEPSTIDDEWE